ncbi:MAG: HAD family hydrolase [Thiolinea sp.]
MALKAIFFDHDGTLVNSEVEHCRFWQTAMQQYGYTLTTAEYMAVYSGIPGLLNAQMLVDDYGMSVSSAELFQVKEAITQAYLDQKPYPLMPEVREVLAWVKQQSLVSAVVSGADSVRVSRSLQGNQISGYFDFVCCAEDVAHNKPDPAVYTLALERSGFKADECLAIEDTNVGVQSAIEAGLVCCAIRNDYAPDHDLSQATVIVNNMTEVRDWVRATYGL